MFAEKLNAVMEIAGISNSMLGRAVGIDASHIGRLRNGVRPLPQKHDFVAHICSYLVRHLKKEHQIAALHKITGFSRQPASDGDFALFLANWLVDNPREDDFETADQTVSQFTNPVPELQVQTTGIAVDDGSHKTMFYYGNEGKRRAVERFFLEILKEREPQTLLLFSDENMSWLYEKDLFAKRWRELFTAVLRCGNRIKIVHTISRDMNEMLEAVTKWIPIYSAGAIDPYYYPRLRDGVFQRTMFIAPKTAAVVSSSVQMATDETLNLFITDKRAITALTKEYEGYFTLCRPLMRIYTNRQKRDLLQDMSELSNKDGDSIACHTMPLLFSMPEWLVKEMAGRSKNDTLYTRWHECFRLFRNHVQKCRLTEFILPPETALSEPGHLTLPMADMVSQRDCTYTRSEYLAHLEHLRHLGNQYANLMVIERNDLPRNLLLYVKDSAGAVIAKSDRPTIAFMIGERIMVNPLWTYLCEKAR